MGSLDVIFAVVVGVLAGLAVIGALTFALVWEWYAIRRTLASHGGAHQPPTDEDFWRQQRALNEPRSPSGRGDVRPGASSYGWPPPP